MRFSIIEIRQQAVWLVLLHFPRILFLNNCWSHAFWKPLLAYKCATSADNVHRYCYIRRCRYWRRNHCNYSILGYVLNNTKRTRTHKRTHKHVCSHTYAINEASARSRQGYAKSDVLSTLSLCHKPSFQLLLGSCLINAWKFDGFTITL